MIEFDLILFSSCSTYFSTLESSVLMTNYLLVMVVMVDLLALDRFALYLENEFFFLIKTKEYET